MKIIIIEDEKLTADDLATTIKKIQPATEITAMLRSVAEAKLYFAGKPAADLIFSDIQLGDGSAFDIFTAGSPAVPVIFCTAYDEYALKAFEANGINYILKPFTDKMIADALAKYDQLREKMAAGSALPATDTTGLEELHKDNNLHATVLRHRDKIIRIPHAEIAFVCFKNSAANLITFDEKSYWLHKSMEEFEKEFGKLFFRMNRQYLVNKKAIQEVTNTGYRKLAVSLNVPADEAVFVSKEKKPDFLNWLRE